MLEKKPKSHKWYIFFRLYVIVVYIAAIIFGISWLASFASEQAPSSGQIIWFGILFPCFAVAVFMIMNVFVFGWNYSILGRLERTAFPNEQPVLKKTGTWGQIGLFRGTVPFFNWYVYPLGLGISILGIGRVFIPYKYIKTVSEDGGSFFSGSRYQLVHNSPEVNSPIYLPDKSFFESLCAVIRKG